MFQMKSFCESTVSKFETASHSLYINHLGLYHGKGQCNFENECKHYFKNINTLKKHVKTHSSSIKKYKNFVVKCNICEVVTLSIQSLIKHMKIHANHKKYCLFMNCQYGPYFLFDSWSKHIRFHINFKYNYVNLKPGYQLVDIPYQENQEGKKDVDKDVEYDDMDGGIAEDLDDFYVNDDDVGIAEGSEEPSKSFW